ncbi:hypothetical protein DEO72_LG11g605 [Vigna unguiculata]|uniref:Uncharacterized protein n=1 Tax=Vigna unguiculata TaxID=3917 RepID=A0A4D6NIK7_VIGUN|nr:hypothetical protein DEO72_LG11g605 [Vigna unguiculata]
MWHAVDLAQARSPRSCERSALAQAVDSRLGETATEGLRGSLNARLGETNSPEQDHPSPKGGVPRLGQKCSDMLRLPHVLA